MTRLRQLRWQLVAAQLLVVVVGVTVLAVTADATGARLVADDLRPLAAAALAAAAVGLTTSVLLLRQILRPLDEIARSSERIAAGRYDERVAVPASDELAAVADSFNEMAAALEAVEARRIALIGNVAHELRTPLAGLEGYLEGLLDGVFTADPATLHELQHEVRRLHRLVDDLQTLSNVEAGQIHLSPTDFDLVALARRVPIRRERVLRRARRSDKQGTRRNHTGLEHPGMTRLDHHEQPAMAVGGTPAIEGSAKEWRVQVAAAPSPRRILRPEV